MQPTDWHPRHTCPTCHPAPEHPNVNPAGLGSVLPWLPTCRASHVLWPPARWGALPLLPCPSGTHVVGKGGTLEFLHPPPNGDDWWS